MDASYELPVRLSTLGSAETLSATVCRLWRFLFCAGASQVSAQAGERAPHVLGLSLAANRLLAAGRQGFADHLDLFGLEFQNDEPVLLAEPLDVGMQDVVSRWQAGGDVTALACLEGRGRPLPRGRARHVRSGQVASSRLPSPDPPAFAGRDRGFFLGPYPLVSRRIVRYHYDSYPNSV